MYQLIGFLSLFPHQKIRAQGDPRIAEAPMSRIAPGLEGVLASSRRINSPKRRRLPNALSIRREFGG